MARALTAPGKEGLLDGTIVPSTDDIRVALVRGYTPSSSHKFLSDVTGGGGGTIVARSGALASKSVTNGIFDAADLAPAFAAVATGAACAHVVFFKHTGSDATARVILYADDYTGLPVTPNGGDINLTHDNGANKIFAL